MMPKEDWALGWSFYKIIFFQCQIGSAECDHLFGEGSLPLQGIA